MREFGGGQGIRTAAGHTLAVAAEGFEHDQLRVAEPGVTQIGGIRLSGRAAQP